jgi:hypothetical protein
MLGRFPQGNVSFRRYQSEGSGALLPLGSPAGLAVVETDIGGDSDMNIKHPVVYLFGAGATRGGLELQATQPPPVDTDFFDVAAKIQGHGTQRLAKKVLADVWKLYSRTNGISLEQYYRDIETRGIIGRFATTANQPKDWKSRQVALLELIRRVMIHTTCKMAGTTTPLKSELHGKILEIVKKGDTLLTFNYDLVIEESFKDATIWTPNGGYGENVKHGKTHDWCRRWFKDRNTAATNPESEVALLKLHGSLNWTLYRNRQVRIKPRPYVVKTKNKTPAYEKIAVLAPGWNKPIDKNPYKAFWREARLRLEQCKTLVIIGYSLPETDLLAKALFAEVIRTIVVRKKYLKQLHLAEPNNCVRQKFIDLFTPALGPAGQIYSYSGIEDIAKKWGGANVDKMDGVDGKNDD